MAHDSLRFASLEGRLAAARVLGSARRQLGSLAGSHQVPFIEFYRAFLDKLGSSYKWRKSVVM